MKKYQWQGKDVDVKFGYCDVTTNKEQPLWWYNYYCRQNGKARLPAVKIIPNEEKPFIISNHAGIGRYKLLNGGWPNLPHSSLDGKFISDPIVENIPYDPYIRRVHLQRIRDWQKKNFPKEYEHLEYLKKEIKKYGQKYFNE